MVSLQNNQMIHRFDINNIFIGAIQDCIQIANKTELQIIMQHIVLLR